MMKQGTPLIRVKRKDLAALGIKRVARLAGARDGLPVTRGRYGRRRRQRHLVHGLSTRRSPGSIRRPLLCWGATASRSTMAASSRARPGCTSSGCTSCTAMSSSMIHGVGRDAKRIVDTLAARFGLSSRATLRPWRAPGKRTRSSAVATPTGARRGRRPTAASPPRTERRRWPRRISSSTRCRRGSSAKTTTTSRSWSACTSLHVDAGDQERAARCAFWLGFRLAAQREMGRAGGWLARAERLVEKTDCVEKGYLRLPAVHRLAGGRRRGWRARRGGRGRGVRRPLW